MKHYKINEITLLKIEDTLGIARHNTAELITKTSLGEDSSARDRSLRMFRNDMKDIDKALDEITKLKAT